MMANVVALFASTPRRSRVPMRPCGRVGVVGAAVGRFSSLIRFFGQRTHPY